MANVAAKDSGFATYSGANLNEIFYEPVFRSDNIMGNYRVIPNVKHKMNVYTSAALTKIVQVYTTCSSGNEVGSFNVDDKVITAGRCRVAFSQCQSEFEGTYIEEMYRNGVDVMNLEGTQLADAIVNRAVKGIEQDVVRLAWGGDTGAGATYKAFDGWMKLMGADSTVLAARTEESIADPTAPVAADALKLIRAMYDNAPAALQQVPASDKKIFVTPKTYNAYLTNLEGTSADLAITNQQDGVLVVKFRGVELVPMYEWDTILADTDPALFLRGGVNGTEGACYCATDNLIVGSDVTDPQGSFKVFYDDLEEKMFFRGYFKLGVQFLYPSLVQWGIFY
jgi:hypothetical protein|tara:strand:- start:1019 stop:2032 length:1014 start_codon:yes stop_codon:yes gene_type:complete